MSTAIAIIERTPFFGRMFRVDESTGLKDINAWPALIVMTSFVWLAIAAVLGLLMPVLQFFDLNTNVFYTSLTLHGAAMTFPFAFQLMVGVSLHRAGGCMGKKANGPLVALFYICMNVGALLLTIAVLNGFTVTYTVMYPLPIVGVETGQWTMNTLILGFTGIALVLTSMIYVYPIQVIRMMFFAKKYEELVLSARTLKDPGMLGMVMAVLILLVLGTPLMIVAGALLLALYGIVPMEMVTWAAEPVVFQFVFYIFAHNLMESMAIMVISAVYATLPLYLADGTRKLYSDKLANLALWILLVTSVTSFFHHFYTMFPALPSALAYHGNIMSWATGVGAALTIFTILATIWKHGIKPEPGVMMILAGFVLYILDGVAAMTVANVAIAYQLHGTTWTGGHAMAVLIAMSMMWMGVLYHHYPVMTGRKLDRDLGNRFVKYYFIGSIGLLYSFMAGGALGMPRRFAEWEGSWMVIGAFMFGFGVILTYSFVLYIGNFMKSREI
jgi:cytochrome c oxidase subunit 1